jgi:quinol monooxygenase YgiN
LGTLAAGDDGEVYVLTHVDIAPRGVEQGLELLEALITASRQEAGAKDIGLIVQDNRQNHMTLFEVWSSAATHEAHITSKHAMRARRELQARIGSLYDERLYRRF